VARTHRLSTALLASMLALSGCGGSREPDSRAAQAGSGAPPGTYLVGADLYGFAGRPRVHLEAPPVAPLAGWLTPVAVPSPDGRRLAYNAWTELREDDPELSWEDQGISEGDPLARPTLRLYDADTDADTLLEEGAFSLAWRADGALAYFKGAERDYRAGVPFVGDVVVRAALEAPAETWSPEPGRYVVAGWAGPHLLGYRETEGEALDVVSFDGPGEMRVLARDAALVALSPDGRRLAVERGPAVGIPAVDLVDVASGRRLASLDLTTVDPAVGAVGYAGDWSEDLLVAPSESGLAVFRVAGKGITLEESIPVEGGGLAEPRFAATGQARVNAWTSTPAGDVFVDCDRPGGTCRRAMPAPDTPGVGRFHAWRRPVYNPSRPLEGEA
jgi:hypothetical protein